MPSSSSRSLDSRALALLVIAEFSLVAGCNASFSFDAAAGSADGGSAAGGALSAGASALGGAAVTAAGTGGSAGVPSASGTCAHDQDCGLPSLHCNVSSMRCVECLSDSECPAA